MTIVRFETCDRKRALSFLRAFMPSRTIEDTPESAGPLLDFVESDVIRIPDPEFHPNGQVMPSTHWSDDKRDDVIAAFQKIQA